MRGMGNFRVGNGCNGETAPTTGWLKGQISFSSGTHSSSGPMPQIAEEGIGGSSSDDGSFGNSNAGNRGYIPGFSIGSWDNSALVSENLTGLKRLRDINGGNQEVFADWNGEAGHRPPMLAHHFSLPKTSTEMAALEKFLQFQDSVPCKVRAKRGCATHPRKHSRQGESKQERDDLLTTRTPNRSSKCRREKPIWLRARLHSFGACSRASTPLRAIYLCRASSCCCCSSVTEKKQKVPWEREKEAQESESLQQTDEYILKKQFGKA
uniref:Uncharacterized protein n=1 Tax=Nelumbo nucifera TaxID=4432 RepID=A0A822YDN2_NELNU|nr:TPA_asm: hypothetical protein HUJ06_009438 [Nelumbo nucifera]